MMPIRITTSREAIDLDVVHSFITQSYWAKGRTRECMQTCIDHSLPFSLWLGDQQIGFARVLTDYGQFAYLMDVFILPEHQGKGYALRLLQYIQSHPDLQQVRMWRLATKDAHGLYEKLGFTPLAHPENMLEWKPEID